MAALLAKVGPQGPAQTGGDDEHYLWPCNQTAWHHWGQVQSQWRMGMGGPSGIDYAGLRAYLDEQAMAPDERTHTWACITACERSTLQAWAEKAAAKLPPT